MYDVYSRKEYSFLITNSMLELIQTNLIAFALFSCEWHNMMSRNLYRLFFNQNYPKSSKVLLVLPDFDGFSTPQYSPANRAYSPRVPNPSNSTGCFCWIQDCVQPSHGCFAFATLHIPSKSNNWGTFLLHVDGFWMVSSKMPRGLGFQSWYFKKIIILVHIYCKTMLLMIILTNV